MSAANLAATSPWLNARGAARYISRSRRFILAEIKRGRLRAARIGGRGEILTRREWLDEYVTQLATPAMVSVRRSA
jgi:excisionase family DNA binding protein